MPITKLIDTEIANRAALSTLFLGVGSSILSLYQMQHHFGKDAVSSSHRLISNREYIISGIPALFGVIGAIYFYSRGK